MGNQVRLNANSPRERDRTTMKRLAIFSLLAILAALCAVPASWAQRPGPSGGDQDRREDPPRLPDDPQLLALHKDFVDGAMKLAQDYERKKEWDKAKTVYSEILKLVPRYPNAVARLDALRQQEAMASKATFTVKADQGWQDTGLTVEAGKPLAIRASGNWTFTLTAELTPDGMKIPEELRDYNLGCLMGLIDTGNPKDFQPFVIGSEHSFTAEKSGRLFLRMYDVDPKDNSGSLKVDFIGTFEKRK